MFNIADIPKLGTQETAQLKSILEKLNEQDELVISGLKAGINERNEMIVKLTEGANINSSSPTRLNGHHVNHDNDEVEESEADTDPAPKTTRSTKPGRKKKLMAAVNIPAKYDPNESKHIKSLWVLRKTGSTMTLQQITDKILQLEKAKKGSAVVANLNAILSQQSKPGRTLISHKNFDGKLTGYELREDLK